MSSLPPEHEPLLRACDSDPALRNTILKALKSSSKPDRLKSLGRRLGRMRSRFHKLSDTTRQITDRVRDGYRDGCDDTKKGSDHADDDS